MKSPFLSPRLSALRADKLLAAFLVCVFLVLLLFNFLTPLSADDYNYSFSFADGKRITNPLMIFPSMAAHRSTLNGRVFSHALTQFFLMLPKAVFNFFNALNAVFLLVLLYLLIYSGPSSGSGRARSFQYPVLLFSAAALIWCCVPDFGTVFLWLDGSCNYSWALSVSLIYLLPFCAAFLDEDISMPRPIQALFLIHSFIVGAYSENNSCTAIFLSFFLLLFVFLRRRKLSPFLPLSLVTACLGLLFLVRSPAERERINLSLYDLFAHFRQLIETYCLGELLPLFLLYAACFVLALLSGVERRRILLSFLFFCGALLSGFVFIFALYIPGRAMCAITVYLVLASLILLSVLWDGGYGKLFSVFSGLLAVFFVFNFLLGAADITALAVSVSVREDLIAEAKAEGITKIGFAPYPAYSKYSVLCGNSYSDITPDPSHWRNVSYASYYGFEAVWIDSDLIDD